MNQSDRQLRSATLQLNEPRFGSNDPLENYMKRRILLVDDELAILLTLRAILEMNGFEVDTAASAKEAGQKLTTSTFEMVITDMRMETETAGYDVIRAARQQGYDPATAILTAYPSLGDDWQSRGAQSLLVKPVNTQELLRQIENLLTAHQTHKLKAPKSAPKVNSVTEVANRTAAASKKAI
jgi:DNA-binding response OmpR family regulator